MKLPEQNANSLAARYWDYSLDAYAQAGVQTLCLQLQRDYRANVNLLLFAGFVGSSGMKLVAENWSNFRLLLAPINRRYTQRIRRLRERAQQFASSHIPANECYQQLKALELRAERIEQLIVAGSCDNEVASTLLQRRDCAIDERIEYNLLAYYASWPSQSAAAVEVLRDLAAALLRNGEIKGNLLQR